MSCKVNVRYEREKEKQKEYKGKFLNENIKKESEMSKFWTKKNKNLVSLVFGIILIIIGMGGTSISLLSLGIKSGWAILPIVSFIAGIYFAYKGANERW